MAATWTPPYHSVSKIRSVVELMQTAERYRAENRTLINNLFNGQRPYSEEQVKKLQIQYNVNWNEGANLIQRANTQINGALLHKGNFFNAKCLRGPIEKRDEWGAKFTEFVQDPMKRGKSGKKYMFLMRNRNASLTLHGIGPLLWLNDFDWLPRFVPLEDLLIPTDTLLDFSNLTHFAVSLYPTPYELFDMAYGGQKGWSKKVVNAILAAYKDLNQNPFNYDWYNQPERMAELWKQNRVPCDNDSVPVVRLICFFYRDTESTTENEKWNRKIILREAPSSPVQMDIDINESFVFEQENFARDIDHVLHVQFGDCSIVPPLKYQSVRGLGIALYSVIEAMNRLRCQFAQHVFEQFLMYFRIRNPVGQDRPKQMQMIPFGVIPEGIDIVPNTERHRIDPGLVDRLMSQNRELMAENSASFVQDVDQGRQGNPITATEANIRLQSVNVIVSSMLNMLYTQENFCYEEIVRRFLLPTSKDPDVIRFRDKCRRVGIPDEIMKPDCWLIDAERVFGGGDQMLAEQEVSKLLALSPQLDPTAQRIVKRQYVTVITRDPAKGRLLVPEDENKITDGRRMAEIAFGGLMADGLPRALPEGIEREDYIETLLQMAEAKVQGIAAMDNMGSPQELLGLQAVLQHIAQNLEVLGMDESKKPLVKMFGDMMGQLENALKGFAQRLAEENSQGEIDPEAQAKAQATVQKAALDARIKQSRAAQDLAQRQAKFEQEMRQNYEKHIAQMQADFLKTKTTMLNDRVSTLADVENRRKMDEASNGEGD